MLPMSPEGTSSICFFWCFLVHTFYVFVISIFSVFTYIHCAHTRSRSALLVYLGERTGSFSGLISLSISDFSIGSVQSHHIYVFCTSSLALYLEGHIYLKRRRSSDQPDTSIPPASKIAQIDLWRSELCSKRHTLCMCIYTMSIHTLYLVSDLEGSDNSDPLYGIIYCSQL